ncbi:hypothetical protein HYR53_10585 [Candidatus Acetothermia bacterium]|nr:hypothetical protein [Candidatus Acetothermia bacterium]
MAITNNSIAVTANIERRLADLRDLRAELESKGETLTTAIISQRCQISKRQALRYKNLLNQEQLEAASGGRVANSLLDLVPLMAKILKEDLRALDEMSSESQPEKLALIKTRRDQVIALSRLGSHFLKELRDLGLLPKSSKERSFERGLSSQMSAEMQLEIERVADEELEEFERELSRS